MKKMLSLMVVLFVLLSSFTLVQAEGQKIGVLVSMITGYYAAMVKGIEDAGSDLGLELVMLVAEDDSTKQNQQMENLIAQNVSAIVCNAVDGTAIAASVESAMDSGIPVVAVDRQISGVTPTKSIINDSYALAYELVETYALSDDCKNLDAPLNVIVLVGSMSDSYAVNCLEAMRDAIAKYPEIFKLITEVPGDWNQDTALKGLQNALSANANIDLIITPSDMYQSPIKSALEQIGRWQKRDVDGHVALLSMDGDSNGLQAIYDGYAEADAVIDAWKCGYWGVEYAYKLALGEETADGATVDLPGFVVTYENFDELAPTAYSYGDLVR